MYVCLHLLAFSDGHTAYCVYTRCLFKVDTLHNCCVYTCCLFQVDTLHTVSTPTVYTCCLFQVDTAYCVCTCWLFQVDTLHIVSTPAVFFRWTHCILCLHMLSFSGGHTAYCVYTCLHLLSCSGGHTAYCVYTCLLLLSFSSGHTAYCVYTCLHMLFFLFFRWTHCILCLHMLFFSGGHTAYCVYTCLHMLSFSGGHTAYCVYTCRLFQVDTLHIVSTPAVFFQVAVGARSKPVSEHGVRDMSSDQSFPISVWIPESRPRPAPALWRGHLPAQRR